MRNKKGPESQYLRTPIIWYHKKILSCHFYVSNTLRSNQKSINYVVLLVIFKLKIDIMNKTWISIELIIENLPICLLAVYKCVVVYLILLSM